MSLLGNIAEALEGKECSTVQADLGNMVVKEFIQPRSDDSPLKTVLLCESPHTSEMRHGHAFTGKTGKNITAALRCTPDFVDEGVATIYQEVATICSGDAIGCLLSLSKGSTHPVLDSLGLMNVSLLPLQKKPYSEDVREDGDYGNLLRIFEKEKNRLGKRRVTHDLEHSRSSQSATLIEKIRKVRTAILGDLKGRLRQIPNSALVIPCGPFARNFLRQAECNSRRDWSDPLRTGLQSLPHPNKWHRKAKWSDLPPALRALVCLVYTRAVQ